MSSYYRSPYLDSNSSSSTSTNYTNSAYTYPEYDSKYESLLSRNPDGVGKSRAGILIKKSQIMNLPAMDTIFGLRCNSEKSSVSFS